MSKRSGERRDEIRKHTVLSGIVPLASVEKTPIYS